MFELPEEYKIAKKIAMKDFIPKGLKPDTKKKIKNSVKKVVLSYQIMGEEIPSVIDSTYRYEVIQFFDFELVDMKKAEFVAKIYQEIIKSPCVLQLHDTNTEVYSFALKRLNQNEHTEIVVTDSLLTQPFPIMLPNHEKDTLFQNIAYPKIINKTNKVTFYLEIYVKAFILQNDKVYSKSKTFLTNPIWYNENKVRMIYSLLSNTKEKKEKLTKVISNGEKMKLNQEIRATLTELDKL